MELPDLTFQSFKHFYSRTPWGNVQFCIKLNWKKKVIYFMKETGQKNHMHDAFQRKCTPNHKPRGRVIMAGSL
jgi:hypothetical protein